MVANDFEKFCETVQDFWPRYNTSPPELHGRWVDCCTCYGETDLLKHITLAFKNCKTAFPNPPGPNWENILADLRTRTARHRNNAFRELLEWNRLSTDRSQCEPDADIWARYLAEQARQITHSRRHDRSTGRPVLVFEKRECDPCSACECGLDELACRAERRLNELCSRWRNYIEQRGDVVPAYLVG
ncbi:hypothetical protein LCGC14_3054970 [marine sediment metagenome]|uniref:Uncharacterized protein n=1 Tax=marine sediment metagenome TaxID=412755 RepID=A0A0F8WL44_9ZZZZ